MKIMLRRRIIVELVKIHKKMNKQEQILRKVWINTFHIK